jgi:hypothetical protein
MSTYYVRNGGKVYGPFTQQQLSQLSASGRVLPQTEVSTDQVRWLPASSVVGTATPTVPPASSGIGPSQESGNGGDGSDTKRYLKRLRERTHYPFYRTVTLIVAAIGYMASAAPLVALGMQVVWNGLSSVEIWQPFAAIVTSGLSGVFVTVLREVASMYADIVDSTVAFHSKMELR